MTTSMTNSMNEVLRSLGIAGDSAETIKRTTREWLERAYHEDTTIAELNPKQIRKQATKLYKKHGRAFFGPSSNTDLVDQTSWGDLISKIADIMEIQVRYKSQKIQKSRAKALASEKVDSDCDSIESSQESNMIQTPRRQSYAPSDATLETPLLKTHNTRANTRPGMPLHQSIEITPPNKHIVTSQNRKKRKASDDKIKNDGNSAENKHSVSPVESGTCLDLAMWKSTPGLQEDYGLPYIATDQSLDSLLLDFPSSPAYHTGMSQQDRSRSSRPPTTKATSFDPQSFRFTPFLNIPEVGVVAPRPASPATQIICQTSRSTGSRPSHCQLTPPSSIDIVETDGNSHHEVQLKSHRTPSIDSQVKNITDLTERDEHTFFISNDFKSVPKDRALKVLGAVINVLNNALAQYQSKVNDMSLLLSERKLAEQEARCLCELLSRLTKDDRVWD